MARIVRLDPLRPLSNEAAIKRIRMLWREGEVAWPRHAKDRLLERKLDILDVEYLARYGQVVESSRPGKFWRYKIKGRTVEGKTASAVFEINGNLLTVVTVMPSRR
jgi:hypothetical protein